MDRGIITRRQFWFWIGFFALLGAVLRLWALPGQVLVDDEWHALNFVQNKTLQDVFLKQGMGANSIPVNIYTWLVLHTVGWSEPALRLPALLSGIATIVVVPQLGRRLWGGRVAIIAAALIAVAPTLIFYSRVARPYGPVMLFGASSVLLTLIWQQKGRRRDLLFGAGAGAIAIYFHLYAAIPVVGTLGMCLLLALFSRKNRLLPSPTPIVDLTLAGAILALIDGLLVVVPNLLNPWWMQGGIHGKDHATAKTVLDFLSLVSGTHLVGCKLVISILIVAGFVLVILRSWVIGIPLLAPFLVFAAVASLTSQEGSQAAIQVARYGIIFFPLLFLVVAVAVDRGVVRCQNISIIYLRSWVPLTMLFLLWSPFLITSPLWRTYQLPNNFTNESAYQYHYEPHSWEISPERDLAAGVVMPRANIPHWYSSPQLAAMPGIIEYPMLLGDHYNFYYFYQHFHRRPVRVGFLPNSKLGWRRDQFVSADQTIDHVMDGISLDLLTRCNWQAMVNLADVATLRRRYPGWLVILHANPLAEAFPANPKLVFIYPNVARIIDLLQKNFGDPVFSDNQIAGWVVK